MPDKKPRKVNYLNNKDILKEIQRSKLTFCYVEQDQHRQYDIIVDDLSEIDDHCVDQARKNRASRISSEAYNAAMLSGDYTVKPKQKDFAVDPSSIPKEQLVFRVMTYDHIPDEPGRKRVIKKVADSKAKVNFPPFKQYVFKNDELCEVVRSHWRGDLMTGEFCTTHGRITNELGKMFIKLVDRYGQKGNWRGYCVDTETQALTQRGWLGIDEINESDQVLSCRDGELTWSKIHHLYRGEYSGLMHNISNEHGLNMLVTPGHKLVTDDGPKPVELIRECDKIKLLGAAEQGAEDPIYSDSFVELVGWIVTEGNYERNQESSLGHICIWQSQSEFADRIRRCLTALEYEFSENHDNSKCFAISRKNSREIEATLPNKNLTMDFILRLTQAQRQLLFNTMIDGDSRLRGNTSSYVQKNAQQVDMFQALATLTGRRSMYRLTDHDSHGEQTQRHVINVFSEQKNQTNASCLDFNGGKGASAQHVGVGEEHHPNVPTTQYDGMVWCVHTDHGSFVVRRNGNVYLTGNSYLDEMKGQTLLHLSIMGLQFNEHKSVNPFGYYTTTVTNTFTRVLNLEKNNQKIRDEILIDQGHLPSYGRQLEHEEEIKQKRREIKQDQDS